MILNLAAAFLAASSINGPAANQALESIDQANASEICVRHAMREPQSKLTSNKKAGNSNPCFIYSL